MGFCHWLGNIVRFLALLAFVDVSQHIASCNIALAKQLGWASSCSEEPQAHCLRQAFL